MTPPDTDHYATLGLDRRCTLAQIRAAYRLLAKRHHPDVNGGSAQATEHAKALNAAHEVLSDSVRRRAYDRELSEREAVGRPPAGAQKIERNISQDSNLRIEDFLRGTTLSVRVNDPANPDGPEVYDLVVPPETAPGTRFRLPRSGAFAGGFVQVRVKALPGFRFKARGSDLRCDLRIQSRRAEQGGTEMMPGPTGALIRVSIPAKVGRGAILRIPGEGLPKPRGGRGDLLVRITYRPEVRISRSARR
ncbi:MAG TPA: DnaJ domain-containing protein [Chthoniobacter sp.]|nr:DnaJ domain-containing protein [Chthoniobacter sp.]